MSAPSWEDLHPEWSPVIWSVARQAAGPVRHLYDDLYQHGWIVFLERIDPEHPHHVPVAERELLIRIVHDAMRNYRVEWLSGNTGRHPRSTGPKVLSVPQDPTITPDTPRRRVEMGSEARGHAVRQWLPPRAREVFEKKARGEKLTQVERNRLYDARKSLAKKAEVTRPPATCADCAGHPEYLGDDGVWRCHVHRTTPVLLWNHPEERTIWSRPVIDSWPPGWREYPRRTPRPQHSDEYKAWLAEFRRIPVDERDKEIAAWTRRRRLTL